MNLSKLIHETLEKQSDEPRNYIGASSIGNPCERAIWYGLHRPEAKEVSAQQRMTFEIGKILEKLIKELLRNSGLIIEDNLRTQSEYYLFFQGYPDGFFNYKNSRYILEIKTANDSNFNTFKNKGLRLWNSQYYDQIQSYMGMSGVHKCYLLAINKNTSELHYELILFDAERYEWLVAKAKRIGEAVIEPPRINGSPSYFRCRMCFYKKICHE